MTLLYCFLLIEQYLFNAGQDENGKEEEWDPQLQIENVLGDAKEEEWRYKEAISPDHFRVFECRRIKGVFVENLELQHFPFDTQVINSML